MSGLKTNFHATLELSSTFGSALESLKCTVNLSLQMHFSWFFIWKMKLILKKERSEGKGLRNDQNLALDHCLNRYHRYWIFQVL